MTALLEKAIEATKALDPGLQDEAVRLLLVVAGLDVDDGSVVALTDDEKTAIDIGLAAAERGDRTCRSWRIVFARLSGC